MKTAIWFLLIGILVASCNPILQPVKQRNLTILHLKGNAYERGFIHGENLQNQIDTIISRWRKEVENNFNTNFEKVIHSFFEKTTMHDTIKKYSPDLLEEIRGIADGSKQSYEIILALQMSEEIEIAGDYLFSAKCTSIGSAKTINQPTIVAQNMDPPLFIHGFPTLLHIINSNEESYIFTFPGFIGLCGMSKKTAVACNGISMLNHRKDGLPVAFIMRSVLTKNNEPEAFSFIKTIPHATPQCYTIGGIDSVKCFECSANSVDEFYPFDNKNFTLHTNFANINRDFNQNYIDLLAKYNKTIDDPYFCPRYFLAYDKIKETGFNLDAEKIKDILSLPEPKLQPISNSNTYGCLVMEIKENPVLLIAPGKPNKTEFVKIEFN